MKSVSISTAAKPVALNNERWLISFIFPRNICSLVGKSAAIEALQLTCACADGAAQGKSIKATTGNFVCAGPLRVTAAAIKLATNGGVGRGRDAYLDATRFANGTGIGRYAHESAWRRHDRSRARVRLGLLTHAKPVLRWKLIARGGMRWAMRLTSGLMGDGKGSSEIPGVRFVSSNPVL